MLFEETWCPVASLGVRNQQPKHDRWHGRQSWWFSGMEKKTWKPHCWSRHVLYSYYMTIYHCITMANFEECQDILLVRSPRIRKLFALQLGPIDSDSNCDGFFRDMSGPEGPTRWRKTRHEMWTGLSENGALHCTIAPLVMIKSIFIIIGKQCVYIDISTYILGDPLIYICIYMYIYIYVIYIYICIYIYIYICIHICIYIYMYIYIYTFIYIYMIWRTWWK